MKFLIYILLLITLITSCSKKAFFDIKTQSSDVLYIGVDNKIHIENKNKKSLIVSIDNGTITKEDAMNYIIKIDSLDYTILTINQGKNVFESKFRNKRVPDPKISISISSGFKYNNEFSFTEFRTFKGLVPILNDFDFNCMFRVISYNVTRIAINGKIIHKEMENINRLPNVATQLAEQAETGDYYIFSDIKVKVCGTEELRQVQDLTIRIK